MEGKVTYAKGDVLQMLDRAARRYDFIILDGGKGIPGDARITVYRDDARWAVVLEDLEFYNIAPGHDGVVDSLYRIGNCVHVHNPRTGADYDAIRATSDGPDEPTFLPPYSLHVNPDVRSVRVREKIVPIDLSNAGLTRRGIPVPREGVRNTLSPTGKIVPVPIPPKLGGKYVLWSLLPEHRDDLLATDEEKRRRLPPDLPKFMQLEEWNHPLLLTNRLKPSDSETFQMLAEAIATGDPSRYRPTLPPNTNWRNWLDCERV